MLKVGLTIALVAFISACASSGVVGLKNENNASLESKFQPGVTLKSEILDALGRPTNTSFTDSGLEVLTYEYTELVPRARNFIPYNVFSQVVDAETKELVLLIRRDGLLERFVFNETDTEQRWGVIE
ncbi:MAG: hypothetical protein AAF680_02970 [Pseudomonadota bacterium]